MRPLELALEGFTSFRSEQSLDFTELDLFAITGATGAGKSSLLDALTYALYGTTARTSQASELVSQGATTLKVQLRFWVTQGEYRVTRRWKYRPSTPQTQVLLERSLPDGSWETLETKERETKKAIADILGMDFDTFTRVILLPQGQFDEFLKGNTGKRREILRQLAGFEIFERMRKEANDLARLLKQELATIERQIADLEVPDEIEVEQKRSQLTSLTKELPSLQEDVLKAQQLLDEEERLFAQIARLRQLEQQLTELHAKKAEIEDLEKRLERSQQAESFQADWALVQDARDRDKIAANAVRGAAIRLTQIQTRAKAEREKLQQVREEQAAIAPQIEAREKALATAKVYEEQRQQLEREVAIAATHLQQKQRQQQAAKQELTHVEAKVKAANLHVSAATEALQRYAPGGERLERLNAVAPLLVEWTIVEKQLKNHFHSVDKVIQGRDRAEQSYQAATESLQQAEAAIAGVRAELEAAEKANAEAVRSNYAAALRMSLLPGDTCPVCGGIHPDSEAQLPPLPTLEVVDLTLLRRQETKANQALQDAQAIATKAEAALENLKQKEFESRQELEAGQQHESVLQQHIASRLQLQDTETIDAIALQQEHKALQDSDVQYRKASDAHREATAQLEKVQQAREFTLHTYTAAQTEYQAAIEEVNRREENRREIQVKLNDITEGQPYEAIAQALAQQKQSLAERLKAAEESDRAVQTKLIQAQEHAQQATKAAEEARAKKDRMNQNWIQKLEAAGFSEKTFLVSVASAKERTNWQKAIAHYRETKIEISTRLMDLKEAIGDRTTDLSVLNLRRRAKESVENQLKEAQDRRVELSTWIQTAEQRQKQSTKLLTERETLGQNYETYHTLAQNLKANEFQAYILEHLEAELVARATLLLKELTDSRYALRMQDGEYWVEDNWNGGELRRVRTLSGGETFAASLSMAIALSEKLSMGAQLGSLFLDEGFGTLDAETLESVTQILESLRQQNRLIGVITHVKALGERLPTQVKVLKYPQGSQLEVEML